MKHKVAINRKGIGSLLASFVFMLALSLSALNGLHSVKTSAIGNGWTDPIATMPSLTTGFLANSCLSGHDDYTINGVKRFHLGNDYGALAVGTSVRAIGSGTVIKTASFGTGNGNVVFVKHKAGDGSDFLAMYGHINYSVSEGAVIQAGQQVGTVADLADFDHLHFGIVPGITVPPTTTILGWGSGTCADYWPSNVTSPTSTNGYVDPVPYLTNHGMGTPQTATQPKYISTILTDGTLMAKDGMDGAWVTETGNVKQVYMSGTYIGALLTDGTFMVKDTINGGWVVQTGNVAQAAMSGTRIAVVLTDGTLMTKESINGAWKVQYGYVKEVYLSGNYIGAILTNNNLVAKDGPDGAWVTLTGNVTKANFSGTYIGALLTNGDYLVKDTINGGWVNLMGNVTKAEISGTRIAVVLTNGNLVVKDTINGGWVTETGNVLDAYLSGTYIGARLTDGTFMTKENLNGAWVVQIGNVSKAYISGTLIGVLLTDGTFMTKNTINGGWAVQIGYVVAAAFN